mmetsp:Transcript_6789/g.7811  ORF Transcript_6789/g.7811 Transcript_6789/m.7811 type:complete len:441 (-) Transcript_6789:281-1603(-)|eukprot:CAMPEP_0204613726 /NCGR_PEP_ID=MMETSP0717-20131115/1649_1 /ASSEMBLY_ACC=CAM_ASM_000666 /TAXON_ID=230516 /ORGANISM="Chaetoceros curvisetus" /LENGTH=440 /DNA_ID=CAMNT_0051626245 /DNA_START=153 /DNA_END=1475 /DNA_ORIENTATION=-
MLVKPKALLLLSVLWSAHNVHALSNSDSSDSADIDMGILATEEDFLLLTPTVSEAVRTLRSDFVAWKDRHEKEYQSVKEELHRMLVWIDNHEFIESHNSKTPTPSYTLGHNAFSDHTNDEFQKMHALGRYSPNAHQAMNEKMAQLKKQNALLRRKDELGVGSGKVLSTQKELAYLRDLSAKSEGAKTYYDDAYYNDDDDEEDTDDTAPTDDNDSDGLPDAIDWVDAGAVTPVKNQGQCGSCWAFSSIGAIEGAHFLATSELISLSEQNLMDCDKIDHSCEGGLMENAFQFEESEKGVCTEDDYPYMAVDENECKTDCDKVEHTQVTSYTDITAGDKHGLLASLVIQPTSIAMDAGSMEFQFYSGGVFDDDTCGASGGIDHGVLAVGYGTDEESGHKFFKVKNSWGDSWGDGGYFRIKRESKNEYGTCAVLAYMTAPIVDA